MWWRAAGIVLVLASVAGAQPEPPAPAPRPPRFAIGLGALAGGNGELTYVACTIEAGVLIFQVPVHMRVRAFTNLFGLAIGQGPSIEFKRHGAGVEVRSCRGRVLCTFADLDIGYQKLRLGDNGADALGETPGLLLGPRFGADVGTFIRFRIAVEIYLHLAGGEAGTLGTTGLSLGLMGQF